MRARSNHLLCTVGIVSAAMAMGQTAYPDHVIQDVTWSSGTHHTAASNGIRSPGTASLPVAISGTADAEYKSGTQVRLMPGFHAGSFTGGGQFHAFIEPALGNPDVVVISPDPATHLTDGLLHVEKWEKLEVGLRLPLAYQDAIDRFFDHYYSNGVDQTATPNALERDHDLNPYADDSLLLVMDLVDPSGDPRMKWGFYMTEGGWTTADPTALLTEDPADPLIPYHIRFRFAPDEEGPWQFELSIKAPHSSDLSSIALLDQHYTGYGFVCDPSLPDNHGPLHVNPLNRRTLQFEDGTAFFGLGTNMVPAHGDFGSSQYPLLSHYLFFQRDFNVLQETMERLNSVGGNFIRMYLGNNSFAPEWVNPGVYDHYYAPRPCADGTTGIEQLGNCQAQCWAFDQMLAQARSNDLYVQLCIDPYPPIIDYETFSWGSHPYTINFLEPYAPETPNRYDMKRFFYKNGDPAQTSSGVFYYWKRKYKYIMARWGYSTNIAAIEPFNEIDQMLSYSEQNKVGAYGLCPEHRVIWQADAALPGILDNWLTDIATYVKGEVDPLDPVASALGEGKKLFLMSYTNPWPPPADPEEYFLPFDNPNVDLLDVHIGMYDNDDQIERSFDSDLDYRSTFPTAAPSKPFHNGEYNYYANRLYPDGKYRDIGGLFSNYDVSFHNELWASAFFGNFAAGTTWSAARTFWWPDATPHDDPEMPLDFSNLYQTVHSGLHNAMNILDIGIGVGLPLTNKTTYHNINSLHELLTNSDWSAFDFFNQDFSPHKWVEDGHRIECYYLLNEPVHDLAIGWVHNLNAYWENAYYLTHDDHNFLGCAAPYVDWHTLQGFAPGLDYHVTWFPTRMNTSIRPTDQLDDDGNSAITLDLSTAPFGGTFSNYLDTLHTDYAFIVSTTPVTRSLINTSPTDMDSSDRILDVYPNPTTSELFVRLQDDDPMTLTLFDPAGRNVRSWQGVRGPVARVQLDQLAKGTYCLRIASDATYKTARVIIR